MIIDFHTHVFPDKIAAKTIDALKAKSNNQPYSNGSVDGLLSEMERASIDVAISHPVMTSPTQFDSVTRFAAEVNARFENSTPKIISFAGIHPACENIEEKMNYISERGFKGVKIHPDYQGTFITDEGYGKIFECAERLGLIVITHAGVDGAYRDTATKCTPAMAKEIIRKYPDLKLVLAHYGSNEMFDEVEELLCGESVYFDTAFILRHIGKEKFIKILEKHGADRILFATDSPWSGIKEDLDIIRSFGLDKATEQKILCDNARALLCI
jgi:predicted TIM-barrel fold metal-dependent hydrolase